MTKKTNSLMFRFGLTCLWKHKSVKFKTIANKIQLEYIIYKKLNQKNFNILHIKYLKFKIIIYVYNRFQLHSILKKQVIVYYKKVLCLWKTVIKFGLNEKVIISVLNNINIKKIKLISNKYFIINNCIIFWLFFIKFYILRFILFIIFVIKFRSLNNYVLLFKAFQFINYNYILNLKYNYNKVKHKNRIRKLLGLIYIKLISIQISNLFYLIVGCFFKIHINSILLINGLFLNKNIYEFFKQLKFRVVFYCLFLAINYNSSQIISKYLGELIKKQKNHLSILKVFIYYLDEYFCLNLVKLLGLQLRVTGKLGGKLRKSKYHYKLGIVKLQELFYGSLSYSMIIVYTKFGIISIKIWLLYGELFLYKKV